MGPGLALGEPTRLESVRPPQPGAAVAVVTTDSARDEARWVVRQIQAITGWAAPRTQAAGPVQLAPGAQAGGDVTPAMPPCAPMFGLRDVAILYRVNRQVGEGGERRRSQGRRGRQNVRCSFHPTARTCLYPPRYACRPLLLRPTLTPTRSSLPAPPHPYPYHSTPSGPLPGGGAARGRAALLPAQERAVLGGGAGDWVGIR